LLRRSRKKHSRDLVCFHLQQCIEKYLKARLNEAGIPFPKTHDLERLLDWRSQSSRYGRRFERRCRRSPTMPS
jgi:HEPN domain-containing protein